MPYTNEGMAQGGGHNWSHFWVNAGEFTTNEDGRLPALCGSVHVLKPEGLVPITEHEWEGPEDDLQGFLKREDTCNECADLLREELGLDPRALEDVQGVGIHKADALREAGFSDVRDLRAASQSDLNQVPEIGNALAARIKADVGGH